MKNAVSLAQVKNAVDKSVKVLEESLVSDLMNGNRNNDQNLFDIEEFAVKVREFRETAYSVALRLLSMNGFEVSELAGIHLESDQASVALDLETK